MNGKTPLSSRVFVVHSTVLSENCTLIFTHIHRADPDRPYSFYDLSKDAEKLLQGTDIKGNVGFSIVKHWPPGEDHESDLEEFHDTLNVAPIFFQ